MLETSLKLVLAGNFICFFLFCFLALNYLLCFTTGSCNMAIAFGLLCQFMGLFLHSLVHEPYIVHIVFTKKCFLHPLDVDLHIFHCLGVMLKLFLNVVDVVIDLLVFLELLSDVVRFPLGF